MYPGNKQRTLTYAKIKQAKERLAPLPLKFGFVIMIEIYSSSDWQEKKCILARGT